MHVYLFSVFEGFDQEYECDTDSSEYSSLCYDDSDVSDVYEWDVDE